MAKGAMEVLNKFNSEIFLYSLFLVCEYFVTFAETFLPVVLGKNAGGQGESRQVKY